MLEPEVFIYFLSRSYYENFRCIIKEFNREPIGDYELIRRRNIKNVSGINILKNISFKYSYNMNKISN